MLSRSDKALLRILFVLICILVAALIQTARNPAEQTVWVPDGLYVLAHDSTPFIEHELPAYIAQFTSATGIDVNLIRTTGWDDAVLRAAVESQAIDVVMVPFDLREELRRRNQITPLHTVTNTFPNPNLHTALRWMWSSIDGQPLCGFVIGEQGEPTFACVWYRAEHVDEAAEFIRHMVVHTTPPEHRLVQVNHFARKLLVERDYGAVYDHLLHKSRGNIMDRDTFIRTQRDPCPGGVTEGIYVRNIESEKNRTPKTDPFTGIRYDVSDLIQYPVDYYCVMGERRLRGKMYIIVVNEANVPAMFIPHANFLDWPHPAVFDNAARVGLSLGTFPAHSG